MLDICPCQNAATVAFEEAKVACFEGANEDRRDCMKVAWEDLKAMN